VTDSTASSDHSAKAFGAALATLAAAEVQAEGLTPAELNEIGCRAGEAIRDAARDLRELGLSEQADTWLQTAARSFVETLRSSGRR
jgi:SAM-dependent MidA family methyltransferase